MEIDFLSEMTAMLDVRLDDEQVDVAVGSHVATRSRAEEDNAIGPRNLDDPADKDV